MKRIIRVSDSLTLPIDAVTQTMAAIARKGAGKTYLAKKLAEQMLSAHAQIVVLDVVGNWFGLRISSDAKHPAFEIYVFGGDHGDVPLTPDSGKRIAALIVEKNIPVVLDISSFRKGERERFAAEFAEEFFHRKKTQRSPVHLFIEEAQKLIPQMAGPEERKMLGAFEDIVRLGRNYGIGCTLISQRPQSVNKEVLSQVECLFALQVNGVHERKALEAWVTEHGAERHLVGQLPGLRTGEAFVWSPAWLRIFEKVRIGKIETLDTSATPEVGTKLLRGELSPVDVEALKAEMAEVVAKAEADDPKVLRRRIAELERSAAKTVATVDPSKIEEAKERTRVEVVRAYEKRIAALVAEMKRFVVKVSGYFSEGKAICEAFDAKILDTETEVTVQTYSRQAPAETKRFVPGAFASIPVRSSTPTSGNLTKAERLILTALAQFPDGRSKIQVALLCQYAHSGGGFNNALSSLRTKACIEGSDPLRITDGGLLVLGSFDPLPMGRELLDYWLRHNTLGKAARTILTVLANSSAPMTKPEVAAASGYEANGGGFNNALSMLRTLELINRGDPIELAEELK